MRNTDRQIAAAAEPILPFDPVARARDACRSMSAVAPTCFRRVWPLAWLTWIAACLSACGPKPACQQVENSGRSVASWAATADMVARRWIGGDIPTSYARDTLTQGEQQVRQVAASLQKAPDADPVALARYRRLSVVLAQMDQAIGKGDTSGLTRLAGTLPAVGRQIDALRMRCRAQHAKAGTQTP